MSETNEAKSVGNDTNNKLVKSTTNERFNNNSFAAINLFDKDGIDKATALLTVMMRSEKGGIKSVNDGIAILMRAQDLNLPFTTCIEHIHVINGKTGIDVHIIKALLLKAGVTWEVVDDYTPLYEYTDNINVYIENKLPQHCVKVKSKKEAEAKSKADDDDNVYVYPVKYYSDFNGNIYKEYQLNANYALVATKEQAAAIAKTGKCPIYRIASAPVDFKTSYKLTRVVNGKVMTVIGHFSYSEALAADLFTKDTYKKYPRIMIGNRAFTYAAREIADDLLMGCMETNELKIVEDVIIEDADFIKIEDAQ